MVPFFTRPSAQVTVLALAALRRACRSRRLSRRQGLRPDPAAAAAATPAARSTTRNLSLPGAVLSRAIEDLARDIGTADQRPRRQLHRAAGAVRADQHDARHDLRRRQRRQRDRPRGARGPRRQRRQQPTSTRRSGNGAPTSTIWSRASAARAPNARIVALNMINLAGAPYVASRPHVGEEHHAAHRGRHFRSRQRADQPQRAGRRSDVRRAPVSCRRTTRPTASTRRRRLRGVRRRRAPGPAETAPTTSPIPAAPSAASSLEPT